SWAWPTTSDPCGGADAGTPQRTDPMAQVIVNDWVRAKVLANPSGPGRFPLMRRCRLLIGYRPNCVGSALPEGKSAAVAATRNTQTGSFAQTMNRGANYDLGQVNSSSPPFAALG